VVLTLPPSATANSTYPEHSTQHHPKSTTLPSNADFPDPDHWP